MAMVIANNNAAMLTLGEVNKNNSALGKQLKKVSSGMKINSAGDDASGYAISERMRVRLRSLDQDIRNTQTGSSLLRVVDGAVANIIEELRSLKELALNAANDTNTDLDRATIQKEFEHRKANINDIAAETNYNGKILLDGRYRKGEEAVLSIEPTVPDSPAPAPTPESPTDTPLVKPTNYVDRLMFEQDGQTITIDQDGVYKLSFRNGSHSGTNFDIKHYNVVINAENVVLDNWVVTDDAYISLSITCTQDNTNLYLDDSSLEIWGNESLIRFGAGNNNNLIISRSRGYIFPGETNLSRYAYGNQVNTDKAMVNIGGGLKISLTKNLSVERTENLRLWEKCTQGWAGYSSESMERNAPIIGLDRGEQNSEANIVIYSEGYSEIPITDLVHYGNSNYSNSAYIGSGMDGAVGNITLIGENLTLYGGGRYDCMGNRSDALGAGKNGTVGTIIYGDASDINKEIYYGITESETPDTPSDEPTPPPAPKPTKFSKTGNPLVIHHGTKANEALNVYLEDMHTWALKDEIPSDDDILELARMDTKKAAAYKAMLDEAKDMTLDDAKVTTQHDANVSLRVIDGALNYALEQATHIGAYMSRLDFTEANLVTANESTQASESTIRDADMAKEMAEYTKANVLLQASQSMLAQANQNSSQVISLLQ